MRQVITESQYLAALEKEFAAQPPEGAFLPEDVAKRTTITPRGAFYRLNRDVQRGILKCGVFNVNGRRKKYYWETRKAKTPRQRIASTGGADVCAG